jgi:hypothetical protein
MRGNVLTLPPDINPFVSSAQAYCFFRVTLAQTGLK